MNRPWPYVLFLIAVGALLMVTSCERPPQDSYRLESYNPGNGARNVYRTYANKVDNLYACNEARASRVYWASETEWRCVRIPHE